MARTNTSIRPRLSNLDELFKLDEAQNPVTAFSLASPENTEVRDSDLTKLPFSQMTDFPNHPFRLYDGERKQDMVDSIRENGILQPLIIRALEDGQYHILSGHNRKYCGIEAGLATAPVIIKCKLSDDEALVYVIETNLIQRSFADMLPSEKAAVLSLQHSKMFSQGKRNDIICELEKLSNPHDSNIYGTSSQLANKLTSIAKVGDAYGLSKDSVARHLRIHQLAPELKKRIDTDEISFIPAVALSYLPYEEQSLLNKCLDLNPFKVDIRKADVLRDYSSRGKLNEESIYLILNGEIGQPPKKNRTPTVKVSKTLYSKYFAPKQSTKEIQEYVEKALEYYSEHLSHERENEPMSQILTGDEYTEADEDYHEP